MYSAQHDFSHRLPPKLARLEDQFRELIVRPFDADTLVRLMRMEVEAMYPGLNERDQGQIVDIVLEHMEIDRPFPAPVTLKKSNVIPFPLRRA